MNELENLLSAWVSNPNIRERIEELIDQECENSYKAGYDTAEESRYKDYSIGYQNGLKDG